MTPSSWDIQQEGHVWAFCPQASESGDQELRPVLDIEFTWVDDPVWGAHYFFQPFTQSSDTPHLLQSLGVDMSRVISHLALVHSILIPPISPNPQSCSKRVLVMLPLGHSFDHFYRVVVK